MGHHMRYTARISIRYLHRSPKFFINYEYLIPHPKGTYFDPPTLPNPILSDFNSFYDVRQRYTANRIGTCFYYKFDVGQIIIDNDYGDLSKFQGMSKSSLLLNFFQFIILD